MLRDHLPLAKKACQVNVLELACNDSRSLESWSRALDLSNHIELRSKLSREVERV